MRKNDGVDQAPSIVEDSETRLGSNHERRYAFRVIVEQFQTGEDILDRLNDLFRENRVAAGSVTASERFRKRVLRVVAFSRLMELFGRDGLRGDHHL